MSELENLNNEDLKEIVHVSGMYEDWFLDYASYVILERAVPNIFDGFKSLDEYQ